MLRIILGIVAGYVAMSVALFLLFSGLYMILGTAGSFEPDSYYVSSSWVFAGIVVFFIAAVLAGIVCALVSKNANAGLWMGGVILVLGLLMTVGEVMQGPADTTRAIEQLGLMEAMGAAKQPIWTMIVNPVVGLIGAVVGSKIAPKKD